MKYKKIVNKNTEIICFEQFKIQLWIMSDSRCIKPFGQQKINNQRKKSRWKPNDR